MRKIPLCIFSKLSNYFDVNVLKGAGTAFSIKVLGAAFSIGLQILIARVLELEDYGEYVYVMAWAGMIAGVTSLGFNTSIIRFIPEYLKKKEYGKVQGVINTSITITVLCSLLFAIIGISLILILEHYAMLDAYSGPIYFATSGIIFGLALLGIFGSIEKGKKRMFLAHAPSQVFKHLLIGFGLLMLLWLNVDMSFERVLFVTLASIFVLVILHFLTYKNKIPETVFTFKPIYKLKKWMGISFPLLLINSFLIILSQTDIIMLGIFDTKDQVGIYNVAYKVATLTSFVLIAVNAIAAPTISELYYENKMDELQKFARNIAHLIFWPTLVISIGLVLFSDLILGLFGKEFNKGEILLPILLIGQLVNACVGSVANYLNMTGYERNSAVAFGTAAILNIIFNPIGIYLFGAVGAAIVTSLTTSFWNIWLYQMVKKKIGIKSAII